MDDALPPIGPYQILRPIAKGGMGEVLLAYDPVFDRQVALKHIRNDLRTHEVLKGRFLREAKLTAKLTHPGVISIYSICEKEPEIYYTMPYVEGETLKQLLKKQPAPSILSLISIFHRICQTIAYVHSKGILHRDLKPENILVGKFGEVIILDWGIAQMILEEEKFDLSDIENEPVEFTRPGKIVGTLAYMAPERALGTPASFASDIYALGVILYQILTLRLPFERGSFKEFRKKHTLETLTDPEEAAPYRDVPPRLSHIVKKCLQALPENRYKTMEELLADLQSFIEGRSDWVEGARLDIRKKRDWEFQENILMSKHLAITRTTEEAEWVNLMISKSSFAENIRVETKVYLGETGKGIGFLLSVPEVAEREHPFDGYCLWIGNEETPYTQLFRNTVEVMHIPELFLKKNQWHTISIEKVDSYIHFHLNGVRRFTYLSYLPLLGSHMGLLCRDADFKIEELGIYMGSQNLQVSCLKIPDAFLASRDYKRALAEYRRIANSFPGHAEGREAFFRAGITLLEQAKNAKSEKKSQTFYSLALEEFGKLHSTPGAPIEYLGKSLVYQALKDHEEEIKCLEFALRRYSLHPLVDSIREQVLYRMHESSQKDRRSAYHLILIALRHLPAVVYHPNTQRLFKYVITNWEALPFLENPIEPSSFAPPLSHETLSPSIQFAIPLAFWLSSPFTLLELFEDISSMNAPDAAALGNILYALIEIGSFELARKLFDKLQSNPLPFTEEQAQEWKEISLLLNPLFLLAERPLQECMEMFLALKFKDIGPREFRTLRFLMRAALQNGQEEWVERLASTLNNLPWGREERIELDGLRIWAFLQQEKWKSAEEIFEEYPLELLNQETTLLHALFGCWLCATEGEDMAKIHFSGVIDTPFPRTWALLGHELTNNILQNPQWLQTSFLWERRCLYQQLILFYQCAENPEKEAYYKQLEKQEYLDVLVD